MKSRRDQQANISHKPTEDNPRAVYISKLCSYSSGSEDNSLSYRNENDGTTGLRGTLFGNHCATPCSLVTTLWAGLSKNRDLIPASSKRFLFFSSSQRPDRL
jgi:hypothetical protein